MGEEGDVLATSARCFFGLALVTKLAAGWLGVVYIVITCWPITAITTPVPCIAPFFLPIDRSHFAPPYKGRDNDYSTIPVNVNPLSNRRWWKDAFALIQVVYYE